MLRVTHYSKKTPNRSGTDPDLREREGSGKNLDYKRYGEGVKGDKD